MLYIRILGVLEIQTEERSVRLRGALQSRLLLTLLINSGQLVMTDDLIGELWPDTQPDRVENALQAHVSRLRSRLATLEPDRAAPRLVTHTSGYQLLVAPEELDSEVFSRNLERIRESRDYAPEVAVQELRSCLDEWRGPVLGGVGGGPIFEAAAVRYEELRLCALELLFDLELQVGHHALLVPELRQLLTKYPFHERFWQQLITALYRCGRQTEALVVYRELWKRLTDEFGLEPTPAMQEYERAILERDTSLNVSALALGR
ncbi:DNA-binding SARP family transcriptional activator [Kitasatospora sp. MAA4]|nr:DNA-binding SARP family transcriptional activator [Kitasatospora sp. MAA4]